MRPFFAPFAATEAEMPQWRRMLWVSLGLVYLFIWPLGDLLRSGRSTAGIAVGIAALTSFVATFLALAAGHRPWNGDVARHTWVLLGVATIMAICYPLVLGADWIGLSIYLGVGYAMVLPPHWAARGVFAATALTLVLCLATRAGGGATGLLTLQTLTIGLMMLGFRGSRMLIIQLREARDEVARLAANEERLRIARDLHDLLGHTLSLIVLKSELAGRLADRDPARSLAQVKDIETVARQALGDVREAVTGYRRRSLADELDSAREVLAAASIETSIRTSGTPLPEHLDDVFGWAVREGVTNVVRHARAGGVTIMVGRRDGMAVLDITDDGTGGDTAEGAGGDAAEGAGGDATRGADGCTAGGEPSYRPGSGLAGLGERVARAGGTTEAGPLPGGGFRLVVRAPLTDPDHDRRD